VRAIFSFDTDAKASGTRVVALGVAAIVVILGVAAVFIETHEDPDNAPSDGPNMIPLSQMPALIESLMKFDRLAKSDPISL